MKRIKIDDRPYVYEGFGFPVMLVNAPWRRILNEWVLDVDFNALQENLLKLLVQKPVPLTGAELRFIRKFLELTTSEFGQLLGVSHAAVLKWESDRAAINPATEKCLRLNVLHKLHAKDREFKKAYLDIDIPALAKHRKSRMAAKPISLDLGLRKQA